MRYTKGDIRMISHLDKREKTKQFKNFSLIIKLVWHNPAPEKKMRKTLLYKLAKRADIGQIHGYKHYCPYNISFSKPTNIFAFPTKNKVKSQISHWPN